MKKIITVSMSLVVLCMLTTSFVNAQTVDKGVSVVSIKNKLALADFVKESITVDKPESIATREKVKETENGIKASKASLKVMKANFRATENFKKIFKDALEATWFSEENAIVANFCKDGVNTRVVYDKQGYLIHTISYFPADKTPENIRSIVGNNYPDGDITVAVQVKEGDLDFFIVNLEDKRTIKQVSVYNGSTNQIKEWRKSL